MTEKELFREIGNIKEEYVAEAQEYKRSVWQNTVFRRSLATAACLLVCLGIYWGMEYFSKDMAMQESAIAPESCKDVEMEAFQAKTESLQMTTEQTADAGIAEEALTEMVQKPAAALEEEVSSTDGVATEAEVDAKMVCIPAQRKEQAETDAVQGMLPVGEQSNLKENITQAGMEQDSSLQEAGNLQDTSVKLDTFQGKIKSGKAQWDAFFIQVQQAKAADLKLSYTTAEGKEEAVLVKYNAEEFQISLDDATDSMTTVPDGKELIFSYLYLVQEGEWVEVILATEADLTKEQLLGGEYSTFYLMQYEEE